MTRKKLVVKYVKSCIGYPERQKRTLHALGLTRLGDQVEVPANQAIEGMLNRIAHLVVVDAPSNAPGPRPSKEES